MILRQLIRKLSRYCPFSLQEEWDFCGYQTGKKDQNKEIKSILLCLDFSEEVFTKALEIKPDLILTHHPFIFGSLYEVLENDPLKAELYKRVNEELSCSIYSYHTCFDKAEEGMNRTLLELLDVSDIKSVPLSYLWTARLNRKMSFEELSSHIAKTFGFSYLIGMKNDDKQISKIGFVAGGGSSDFMTALKEEVDCFISSDCPHHSRLDMRRYHINYIEEPHEVEELGFIVGISKILKKIDSNLIVHPYKYEKPFCLLEDKE